MPERGAESSSLLERCCRTIEENLPREDPYALERAWQNGWCLLDGPTCKFFLGESRDADGTEWISFGPVARRAELVGDGEGIREEFAYHLRRAGGERAADTPLSTGTDPDAVRRFLAAVHERVVDDLGDEELLYDGWVVWGWGSAEPWPTIPGLAASS